MKGDIIMTQLLYDRIEILLYGKHSVLNAPRPADSQKIFIDKVNFLTELNNGLVIGFSKMCTNETIYHDYGHDGTSFVHIKTYCPSGKAKTAEFKNVDEMFDDIERVIALGYHRVY